MAIKKRLRIHIDVDIDPQLNGLSSEQHLADIDKVDFKVLFSDALREFWQRRIRSGRMCTQAALTEYVEPHRYYSTLPEERQLQKAEQVARRCDFAEAIVSRGVRHYHRLPGESWDTAVDGLTTEVVEILELDEDEVVFVVEEISDEGQSSVDHWYMRPGHTPEMLSKDVTVPKAVVSAHLSRQSPSNVDVIGHGLPVAIWFKKENLAKRGRPQTLVISGVRADAEESPPRYYAEEVIGPARWLAEFFGQLKGCSPGEHYADYGRSIAGVIADLRGDGLV